MRPVHGEMRADSVVSFKLCFPQTHNRLVGRRVAQTRRPRSLKRQMQASLQWQGSTLPYHLQKMNATETATSKKEDVRQLWHFIKSKKPTHPTVLDTVASNIPGRECAYIARAQRDLDGVFPHGTQVPESAKELLICLISA